MTVLPTVLVLVKCSQCFRLLHLHAPEHIDEDGDSCVDAAPIYWAISLHMTRGCTAKQRAS